MSCNARCERPTRAAGSGVTSSASPCLMPTSTTRPRLRRACGTASSTSTGRQSSQCASSSASASPRGSRGWTGRRCISRRTRSSTPTSAAGETRAARSATAAAEERRRPSGTVLGADFFARDTVTVARELLGKVLVRKLRGMELLGRLVEVEAYLGPDDQAAHSYGGRRTPRNEGMYGDAGHAYV